MRYISIILTLSLLLSSANSEDNQTTEKNITAPSFSLKTANEKTLEVKEIENGVLFEGSEDKIVILSFIAYNGRPCLRAIDTFKEMQKEYKDIDVVAIDVRGVDQKGLKEFAKNKEIKFPLVNYDNAKEFTNYIGQKAGWNGSLPFTLIMDKKGLVKYLQVGLIPLEGLKKIYQEIK
ncbi:TlpA family protein disulfide reductase [Sulfurovum sp. bin170]|uniref:TlpA family protein disulfide reductase n=1 Tax=Sulfurovum sp. bin170 TaxID=2695268 RepID=UPI0013E0B957|nr:TlpA disulfide reductase family protein [Sulfurovum sp. bin170]NEW60157.1 TlpA family protein disulfide reductase [Sulfurovum sp. bin170]